MSVKRIFGTVDSCWEGMSKCRQLLGRYGHMSAVVAKAHNRNYGQLWSTPSVFAADLQVETSVIGHVT